MSLIGRKELKYATGSIAGESPPPDAIEPDVLMFLNLLHADWVHRRRVAAA